MHMQFGERGLLTDKNSPVKYGDTALLQTVLEPLEVAVTHCRGHQKEDNHVSQGNALADKAAQGAAAQKVLEMALIPQPEVMAKEPHYTESETGWAQQWVCTKDASGWWTLDHKVMLLMASQWKMIKEIHDYASGMRSFHAISLLNVWRERTKCCHKGSNSFLPTLFTK